MKVQIKRTVGNRCRLYVPLRTDSAIFREFAEKGATLLEGIGIWDGDYEGVRVIEVMTDSPVPTLESKLTQLGTKFLEANPDEECFLFTINCVQIRITRAE